MSGMFAAVMSTSLPTGSLSAVSNKSNAERARQAVQSHRRLGPITQFAELV